MPVAQIVWLEAFELVRILVRWSLGVFFAKTLNTPTCNTRSWVTMLHLRHQGGPHNSVYISGHGSVWWGMASV